MDFEARFAESAARVSGALARIFSEETDLGGIYKAMNYSLLSGGKRVRGVLALEVCRLCGGSIEAALPLGCAVEMIHTYSLIHDDLPAMDNDDLRRGKPTSHKVFGEAVAILAGDGLLTAAFSMAAEAEGLSEAQRLRAVSALSRAAGPGGMVGGQALDIAGEGRLLDREALRRLQGLKTGALIRCAAALGVIAGGGGEDLGRAVDDYAQKLGLAFQVRDDILDVEGTARELGKPIGSDVENQKTTFVTLLGLSEAKQWVETLSREAQDAIRPIPGSEFLRELAGRLAVRKS